MATYRHQTAGSTFIMPSGKVLRFMGKPNTYGIYITEDADEIAQLQKIADNPQVPMELVRNEADPFLSPSNKAPDPAIAMSVQDAAANSALELDPNVVQAREGLAALLAKG